jgi:glycosyltransferase involved in cell wall biosynthesis
MVSVLCERPLKSCLAQTCGNLELIIIDDGSTDSSLEIMSSFKDDRVILLINECNKGQSYSRNRGTKESRGEYICIWSGSRQIGLWSTGRGLVEVEGV